jgi:tRNA(fMet)-specific endonuclease VapC
MEKIELQLDEQTLARALKLAASRQCTLEELVKEIIEKMEVSETADEPFLGMFADEPELIDQVMVSAMLDTDIFSEILKGIDRNVVNRAIAYYNAFGRYTLSVITVMEVVKVFHELQREDCIQRFLAGLLTAELLTLDLHSSELAGRIYADLERTGQPIGRADPMVAAIAPHHGLTLVTGNLSHYRRIQMLGYDSRLMPLYPR